MRRFGGAGCGVVLMLIGLAVLSFGARQVLKARASEQWPSVPGVVTSAEMSVNSSSGSDSSGPTYGAEVLYEYEAEGEQRVGDRVEFGEVATGDPADAQSVLDRYPVGAEIAVFVNPEDPLDSVLEPGISASTFFLPVFGCVFAFVGALVGGVFFFALIKG